MFRICIEKIKHFFRGKGGNMVSYRGKEGNMVSCRGKEENMVSSQTLLEMGKIRRLYLTSADSAMTSSG